MSTPEEAVGAARAAATEMRARGAYRDVPSLALTEADPRPVAKKLLEWALIEPDLRQVRSTRRTGRPVTALKRGLLRLLQQYHNLLIGDLTRFNINLLVYVGQLESRIEQLEQQLARRDGHR